MDTTKVLVVANAPGILQRVEETLAGLEVKVAIRLRDVGAAVSQHDPSLVILYLGFEQNSTVELVTSLAADATAHPPVVVCLAPVDVRLPLHDLEAQMRAAGAVEFIALADYPRTPQGNDVLRRRILSAATQAPPATPVARVLRRAARIAGGTAALASYLRVPEPDLLSWISGTEETPEAHFLAAFELVLTDLERGTRKPS
jgi:DNA-binding NtrC family response regulator